MAEFFGVPRGHGVLIRSVEGGSPAAAAGLKAGDVVIKVNNETVHDIVDWQRGMRSNANKVSVGILRDKHEQTLSSSIFPAPATLPACRADTGWTSTLARRCATRLTRSPRTR